MFDIYNVGATLALRRFVAMYRRHVLMLGLFVFMVLFSLGFIIQVLQAAAGSSEDGAQLGQAVTPGALSLVAFALLFMKGLVDAQRTVLKDRALWSTLVAPVGEGRVRAGLMLRGLVFTMGLLAVVMGTFALVLLTTPDKPNLPVETGPLIVLAGLAAGVLPIPFLVALMGIRQRSARAVLAVLVALEVAFAALLQMDVPLWYMLATASVLVVAAVAATLTAPPVLAMAWASVEGARFRPSGGSRRMPPMFSFLAPRRDPVARALYRREMVLSHPGKQRLALAGLNVAMATGLVVVNRQLGDVMVAEGYGRDFYDLITPVMVGLGVYMIAFFQAVMPLVDGVSKEGPAFWAVRVAPVEPWRFVAAKVRPLLAFLPLTAVATGFAIPFVVGRGWEAMLIGLLGATAVYLAFLGVGAWAGATYPNLDRHSNAPPDVVLAFYLMFACLILQAMMLAPVLAFALAAPPLGILVAMLMVMIGWAVMWSGIRAGGRSLRRMEIA